MLGRFILSSVLASLLVATCTAEPARSGRSSSGKSRGGKARAPVIHPSRIALPENQGEDEVEEGDMDGSKLFTADTETMPAGLWSVNIGYFLSLADRQFDDRGAQNSLGETRRSDLYILSASTGLSENADLTILGAANRLNDQYPDDNLPASGLGSVQGAGLTNVALQLRWRLVEDEGDGFSLAVIGGPALQQSLITDDEDTLYHANAGFVGWQQSVVLRQDLDPFSTCLELFYGFPLASGPNTFQQFGANLGVGWKANEWLLPVAELNYIKVLPYGDTTVDSLAATVGVVLKPNSTSAISLGVQKTLCGRNVENFTTYTVSGSLSF